VDNFGDSLPSLNGLQILRGFVILSVNQKLTVMTLNVSSPGKSNDELYEDAVKYMDTVFPFLPNYDNFQVSTVITENLRDREDYQEIYNCHRHMKDIFERHGYIEMGTAGNYTRRLTEIGRKAKKAGGHQAFTAKDSFKEQQKKILNYITQDLKERDYISTEISKELDIDVEAVELIIYKFEKKKLVILSQNGHLNITVLDEAFIYAKEDLLNSDSVQNIHNTHNTHNTTNAAYSPIASENSKIEQTVNPEPKKENWFEKIINDIRNAVVSHLVVASLTFIITLVIGKSCSQVPNQVKSQQQPKNSNDASSNNDRSKLDTLLLNNI
jgi:hypothetical protein